LQTGDNIENPAPKAQSPLRFVGALQTLGAIGRGGFFALQVFTKKGGPQAAF
jgi:hypothetical protein